MNLWTLARELRKETLSVEEALSSSWLPEPLRQLFACDCARRALQWEEQAGYPVQQPFWEVLRLRELTLEGEVSSEELEEACQAAWMTKTAIWDVFDAAEAAATYASRAAWRESFQQSQARPMTRSRQVATQRAARIASHKAFAEERREQALHLAHLLEEYHQQRQALVRLLFQRQQHLARQLPVWQQETEDRLF